MEKKNWTNIFSPETGLTDKQKTVLTSRPTNFCRKDRQNAINAQWSKKKKRFFFEKKIPCKISPWTRGEQFWQPCRLFSEKKALIFWLKVRKGYIKQTKVCQNGLKSSNWSLGPVDCSVVNLAEKKSNKDWSFYDQCPKMIGKKYLRNFFSPQTGQIDKQKAALTTDREIFVEMTYKNRSKPNDEKNNFFKKNLHKIFGHVVSSCDKFADCFSTKKNRYFSV